MGKLIDAVLGKLQRRGEVVLQHQWQRFQIDLRRKKRADKNSRNQ